MHYLCQACLRTGDDVVLMSLAEIDTFREFVCQAGGPTSQSLHMCVLCRALLRRLARFVRQCRHAQDLLARAGHQGSVLPLSISFYNLRCNTPTHMEVGLEPLQDTLEVDFEEQFIGGVSDDEDDVPLVMLKTAGDAQDAAEGDRGQQQPQLEQNSHTEKEKRSKKRHKKKKHKQKPLREGFTSRMVQETDEYIVIKLTHEQVLEEMSARALSERYRLAPYRCERCVLGFNFDDVLRKHMERHEPRAAGDVQCALCGQYCAGAVSLRGHVKCHTTRYQCKVCGLTRRSRQHVLEHHALAHAAAAAPRYRCTRCEFTTHKRTVMQHHVRGHAEREPHACHRCGKLYKNLETLRIHITRHESSRRVRCTSCPLSFVSAAQLQRHATAVHERREYYCVECDLLFNSSDTLKLHFQKAKRHRDVNSYKHKCSECERQFVSASSLAAHARAAHAAPPTTPSTPAAPATPATARRKRKTALPEVKLDAAAELAPREAEL